MAFSIEEALVGWLPDALGVPSYTEVPDPRPEEFSTVERTGGTATVGIDSPTVAVQLWAGSKARAEELALDCRDMLLERAAGLIPQVRGVSITGGPYPFPDEDSRTHRYQISVALTTE